jgi:hypothetical protein
MIGVFVALLVVAALIARMPSDQQGRTALGYLEALRTATRRPGATDLLMVSLLRTTAFMGSLAYISAAFDERFGLSTGWFSLVWSTSGLAFFLGNFGGGKYLHRRGTEVAIPMMVAAICTATMAMVVLYTAPTLWSAWIAVAVVSASHAVIAAGRAVRGACAGYSPRAERSRAGARYLPRCRDRGCGPGCRRLGGGGHRAGRGHRDRPLLRPPCPDAGLRPDFQLTDISFGEFAVDPGKRDQQQTHTGTFSVTRLVGVWLADSTPRVHPEITAAAPRSSAALGISPKKSQAAVIPTTGTSSDMGATRLAGYRAMRSAQRPDPAIVPSRTM